MGELRDAAAEYDARGLGIAVVLAQGCEAVERAIARAGVRDPFPVLCDQDRAVIRRYGVWHPIGFDSFNTAHPASFLIDARTARVRYCFVGSTQFARAPLDAILDAAETGG